MKRIAGIFRSQPVLCISFIAALITIFIVQPDGEYIGYINKTVLIQLFSLMAAVAGLRSAGIFDKATAMMIRRTGNIRRLGLILILICYFSAMLVTNDVALITFVPLTLLIYSGIDDERSRILTIVFETIAANMGSMMTPVGNPQNLYLYDKYKLTALDFIKTALPAGLLSLGCLVLLTLMLPKTSCRASEEKPQETDIKKTMVFAGLFIFCLLCVFRIVPDYICLIASIAAVLICDRRLLKTVDYPLLGTFVCFFVFVGNIARIEAVSSFFSGILTGRELIVSSLLSQVISNVPAAVMLSGFTDSGKALLIGVNIGGLGTIIASLASLISFQFYRKAEGARSGRYMATFSVIGFAMLILLLIFETIIMKI